MKHLLPMIAALVMTPHLAQAQDALPSQFGCSNYEFGTTIPAVEGKEGVFYRSLADLRLQHPMDDLVMDQMGRVAAALKEQGTTLVYVVIPPKSVVMPELLPPRAADYGFELEVAEQVYDDIRDRLAKQGIIAPDLVSAMRAAPKTGEPPFFGADFHWTSTGARLAAEAIGQAIQGDPAYADLTPKTFVSSEAGISTSFSTMRLGLQAYCIDALPPVQTMTYETAETASADGVLDIGLGETETATTEDGTLDIFGNTAETKPDVVLVGTSFSDSDVNNFSGFLQEYTGLEVVNFAITGGNQFGSMTSYLSSREFRDARPRFLIWENPVYNNLAGYGPAPLEELIGLARGDCAETLATSQTDDKGLTASLAGLSPAAKDMIEIDFGAEGPREVDITLTTETGIVRHSRIERGDRLRATGRFFLWLEPYWLPDLSSISVTFDRPVSTGASLSLCRNSKGNDL